MAREICFWLLGIQKKRRFLGLNTRWWLRYSETDIISRSEYQYCELGKIIGERSGKPLLSPDIILIFLLVTG